ncbi:MAG: acyl-CoA/acyl-ACP dehydrogenase [Myxococcales bacterium]|nr:acyl-CoA/acyl-ACP dehydrogenase [Myxococcales bacterium]
MAKSVDALTVKDALGVVEACEKVYEAARLHVKGLVSKDGKIASALLDQHQMEAHAIAYMRTDTIASRNLIEWVERLEKAGELTDYERRIMIAFIAEAAAKFGAAIEMGPVEKVKVSELGVDHALLQKTIWSEPVWSFVEAGASLANYREIAKHARATKGTGKFGLGDETLEMIQDQFAKFANEEIIPVAPKIHDENKLIPIEIVNKMAELGVFSLTIPEEYGGAGLGKLSMVVVTEELSRGYIGAGSLGTRSEIAGELIRLGGTEAQKQHWLPKLATGEILPTAVFTEPNNGSDLATAKCRADKVEGGYKLSGQKTWITHAGRADLMTVIARSIPTEKGYKGLSMFLAEKTRGTDENPFPDEGIDGTEIEVLGYRGMREYEMSFDGFFVKEENLLGGAEGAAFKQLMATFESARIQTAARAVGLAQAAFDLGLRYAEERPQFGRAIIEFPRMHRKIARMAVITQAARQITYYSARQKDSDQRCDLEAGMAKLLATKVAWEVADSAVQIHGGNGYALEYPVSRVLVDSRVLSIFEGTSEIQAHVVSRRLLEE